MPYNYRISVEYTDNKQARVTTTEVDGQHNFLLPDALDPSHQIVIVDCSGPVPAAGTPISQIVIKLRP